MMYVYNTKVQGVHAAVGIWLLIADIPILFDVTVWVANPAAYNKLDIIIFIQMC